MVAVHFGVAIDDEFEKGMSYLESTCDVEQAEWFTSVAFTIAAGSADSNVVESVDNYAKSKSLNKKGARAVVRCLTLFFQGCVKNNISNAHAEEDLLNLGLTEDKKQVVINYFKKGSLTLARSNISQTLNVHKLIDMDWKFGVTASTDERNAVGNTFIQLKLVLDKGSHTENVYMELTLPQFYEFLQEMEKAKANLENLS